MRPPLLSDHKRILFFLVITLALITLVVLLVIYYLMILGSQQEMDKQEDGQIIETGGKRINTAKRFADDKTIILVPNDPINELEIEDRSAESIVIDDQADNSIKMDLWLVASWFYSIVD